MAKTIEERFWAKVKKTKQCWIWTGSRGNRGYGRFRMDKDDYWNAHRVTWAITFGPIPDGLQVLHHCDNPACVRPDHLFLGTQSDNVRDMVQKNRANRPYGPRHFRTALTEDQVRAMRAEWATGITQNQLARKYGISTSGIHGILHRRVWRHI